MISTYPCSFFAKILAAVAVFFSATSYCQTGITNTSDQPVRLVITPESITFDGKPLRFEEPLKDWIQVLGDNYIQGESDSVAAFKSKRFIYPKLGIDLEVQRNTKSPSSDWVNGQVGTLNDPMNRYIVDVRIRLNPKNQIDPPRISEEKFKNHPYNTMFADYAINFYGAIVDRNIQKEQVLKYGSGTQMDQHFNLVGASASETHDASIAFHHFWGQKPELAVMLTVYPSLTLKHENEVKYFGQVVSR
ncbi:hypothetical protein [Photobacterium galatheae]|uniref:DUF7738 domain-containing protein n=1 Tax=Photobacterium galatheae TaxID=1654360 RepID=A0A066RI83_9GAMM|nr:hypothetical protein [Photobacterium galatheae]KDM90034.1 hypothetical protein EA58_19020 [Photobacterium galatheae]MCM0150012.1 hypothetical protein [Photobacterium galatheae]